MASISLIFHCKLIVIFFELAVPDHVSLNKKINMKNLLQIIAALILLTVSYSSGAQGTGNITNTLGTNGSFTIKDNSVSYLSLSQATGHLTLNRSLFLPFTTSSTLGVIYKGGIRFIHNYEAPGTNGLNTFIGVNSGNFTMSGTSSSASYNTAVGYSTLSSLTTGYNNSSFGTFALSSNTTGLYNSAFGSQSMSSNVSGNYNSAFGVQSLYNNSDGIRNSAFGYGSLSVNTTGSDNSSFGNLSLAANTTAHFNAAFGYLTLRYNTTGFSNSAFGTEAMQNNTIGDNNSAFGKSSLFSNLTGIGNSSFGSLAMTDNTTGSNNSAFGYQSLNNNTTGERNISIGYNSGYNVTTGSNNIIIGFNTAVPVGTSSNQVRIGDSFINYAGIQVAWTITSDRRLKKNVNPSELGLSFISKLRPVSYTRRNDESQKTEYGLIAQEVDEVLKQEGVENSAMLTITVDGMYEMRYNDLLAPMIKAIQELKAENDMLRKRIEKIESNQSEITKK